MRAPKEVIEIIVREVRAGHTDILLRMSPYTARVIDTIQTAPAERTQKVEVSNLESGYKAILYIDCLSAIWKASLPKEYQW
uniref:Uncharacterized protein n=1 Tax=viral metagenome TaxID=1070528 RepID=A0A6M3LTC7_9ZZZZ